MEIVRTSRYIKDLKRLKCSEAEITALEILVAATPLAGDVIPGLQGIRKIRFGFGGRAIYFLQISDEIIVMLNAYAKNEQDDLTVEQKKQALSVLKEFENE